MRVAVLASGNGSNFEAIVKSYQRREIPGELVLLFSDKKESYAMKRAEMHGIPAFTFSPKDFPSKDCYEEALFDLFADHRIDYLILAGYLRIIGKKLLQAFPNRIINIHPSLLPAFPGLHGIEDAFSYGVKMTGVTVHFVDDGVDTGPIVAQKSVSILPGDTLETLTEKIHRVEHQLYPKTIAELFKQEEARNETSID